MKFQGAVHSFLSQTTLNNTQRVKNLKFLLTFAFLVICFVQQTFAQPYPITTTTQLATPQLPQLETMADPTNNTVFLSLILNDVTQPTYNLRLRMIISGNGIQIETDPQAFVPAPIALQYNVPVLLNGADLAEYFKLDNLRFSGISRDEYLKLGSLPEGLYSVCFEAYDYNRFLEPPVSNRSCATSNLEVHDPPVIVNPIGELPMTTPQQLQFNWQNRHIGSFPVEYELRIYEKRQGLTDDQILASMPPLFRVNTKLPTYSYGLKDPLLKEAQEYLTVVHVRDLSDKNHFKNLGNSKPETFILKTPCRPGLACSDNDDCTINDTYDKACNCVGTPVYDPNDDGISDPVTIPPPTIVIPDNEICVDDGKSVIAWTPNHNLDIEVEYQLSIWLEAVDITQTPEYIKYQQGMQAELDDFLKKQQDAYNIFIKQQQDETNKFTQELAQIEANCLAKVTQSVKEFENQQAKELAEFDSYLKDFAAKCEADKQAATAAFIAEMAKEKAVFEQKQLAEKAALETSLKDQQAAFIQNQDLAAQNFAAQQAKELAKFEAAQASSQVQKAAQRDADMAKMADAKLIVEETYQTCLTEAKNYRKSTRTDYLASIAPLQQEIGLINLVIQNLKTNFVDSRLKLKEQLTKDLAAAKDRTAKQKIRADYKKAVTKARTQFKKDLAVEKAKKTPLKATIADAKKKMKATLANAKTTIADLKAACEKDRQTDLDKIAAQEASIKNASINNDAQAKAAYDDFLKKQAADAIAFENNQAKAAIAFTEQLNTEKINLGIKQQSELADFGKQMQDRERAFYAAATDCKALVQQEETFFNTQQAKEKATFDTTMKTAADVCSTNTQTKLAELNKKQTALLEEFEEEQGVELTDFKTRLKKQFEVYVLDLERQYNKGLPELVYTNTLGALYQHILPTDYELKPGYTYSTQVQAIVECGRVTIENKGLSSIETFLITPSSSNSPTKSPAEQKLVASSTALPSPKALPATNITQQSFQANWEGIRGAEYYILEVATDKEFKNLLPAYAGITIFHPTTSYPIENIKGKTFYYRVRGGNKCFLTVFSNTIIVDMSNAPLCIPGRPCDDGYDSTINEYYDKKCNCIHHECAIDTDGDGVCDDLDQCPDGDDNIDIDTDGIPDACDEDVCNGTMALEVNDNSTCDYCATLFYEGKPNADYRFEQLKEIVLETPEGDEVVLNLTSNSQGFHFPYFVISGNYYEGDCSLGQTNATIEQLVEDLQLWLNSQGYEGTVDYLRSSNSCLSKKTTPEPTSANYHILSITQTDVSFNGIKGFYCSFNKSKILEPFTSEGIFLKSCNPDVLLTATPPDDCEKPTFLWSTGETTATIQISEAADTYAVTVTCLDGCTYTSEDDGSCLVGSPCDDNDPCTSFEVYDDQCNCVGQYADSDKDGVCDNMDLCPGHDDKGDDFDNDGLADACDDCIVGAPCDDGDFNTTNDRYIINPDVIPNQPPPPGVDYCLCKGIWNDECGREGHFVDSDGDGVCDKLDVCPGQDDYALPDNDGDGIPDGCVIECEDLAITLCPVPGESTQYCDYQLHLDNSGAIDDDGQGCDLITGIEIWIPNEEIIAPNPDNLPNYTVATFDVNNNGGVFNFPYCNTQSVCALGQGTLQSFVNDLNAYIAANPDIEGIAMINEEVESAFSLPHDPDFVRAIVIEQSNVYFKTINQLCGDDINNNGVEDEDEYLQELSRNFITKNCQWVVDNYSLHAVLDGECENPIYQWSLEGIPLPNTASFIENVNPASTAKYAVIITCVDEFTTEPDCVYYSEKNLDCIIGTDCNDNNPNTKEDKIGPCCECEGIYVPIVVEPEPCLEGTSCDDGNICTVEDVYVYNSETDECTCAGTLADTDGDMVCDAMDICEGHPDYVDTDNDGIPDGCDETLCENEDGDPMNYVEAIRAFAQCIFEADNPGVAWPYEGDPEAVNSERFIDMADWSYFFVSEVLSDNPDLILQDDPNGTGIIETEGDETTDMDVEDLDPNSNDPNEGLYTLDTEGAFDISLITVDSDGDGVCDLFDLNPTVINEPDNNFDGIPDNLEDDLDPYNTSIRYDIFILYRFDKECTTEVTATPPTTETPPTDPSDPVQQLQAAVNCPPITFMADGELNCACECIPTTNDSDGDGVPDEADQCPGADDFMDNNGNCIPDGCDETVCDGIECPLGPCIISSVPVYNDETGICECVNLEDGDFDEDTVCNSEDKCPGSNDLADADSDGIPDGCDLCPAIPGAVGTPCNDNNECTSNETLQYSFFTILLTDFIGANNVAAIENPLDVQEIYELFDGYGTEEYEGPTPPANLNGLEAVYEIDGDIFADIINGCDCIGTEYDSDNDGVCDPLDVCEGFPDFLDYDGDGVADNDYDSDGIPDGCDPPFYEIGCPPSAPTFLTGDYTGIILEFEGTDFPADQIPNPVSFTLKKADGGMLFFTDIHLTIYQTLYDEGMTSVLYEIPGLNVDEVATFLDSSNPAFIGEIAYSGGQYCSYLGRRKEGEPAPPTNTGGDPGTGGGTSGGPSTATPFACPNATTEFYVENGFLAISQTPASGNIMNFNSLPTAVTTIDLAYDGADDNLISGGSFTSNYSNGSQLMLLTDIAIPGLEATTQPLTGISGSITFDNGTTCQYDTGGGTVYIDGCFDDDNNPVFEGQACDDQNPLTHNDQWTAACECIGQIVHDADGDGVHDSEDQCPDCPDVPDGNGGVICDCACPVPVLAVQDYGDGVPVEMIRVLSETTVNIQLAEQPEGEPAHASYSITWTPEGGSTEQPLLSEEREFSIDNLTKGVTYTFSIVGICESGAESAALEEGIYLPSGGGACLEASPGPDTENCPVVTTLTNGDAVTIGDFEVIISTITSNNGAGVFAGTAYSLFPLFQAFESDFEFTNLEVRDCNGQFIVHSGSMAVPQDGDIMALVDAFSGSAVLGEGDLLDNVQNALEFLLTAVEGAETIDEYNDENIGNLATTIADILPNFPFIDNNLIADLTNSIQCMSEVDGTTTTFEDCKEENDPNMVDATEALIDYITNLYNSDYQVVFYKASGENPEPAAQNHGFDGQQYQIHEPDYDQLIIAGEPYSVPWKSVKIGETDKVNAHKKDESGISGIEFKDIADAFVDESGDPVTTGDVFGADKRQLDAIGLNEEGNINEIFAIQSVANAEHDHNPAEHIHIAGKLNVVSYPEKSVKVQLVKVNPADLPSNFPAIGDLETDLDDIYSQAVMDVEMQDYLTLDGIDLSTDFPNIPSGWLSAYNTKMNDIIGTFKSGVETEDDTYYIFLLPVNHEVAGKRGFMPRKRQFGFLFLNTVNQMLDAGGNVAQADLAKTIAHELGHGAFRLQHTFETYPNNPEVPTASHTNNLMDYGKTGTHLRKYQWDLVQNPEAAFTLFDWDEDGGQILSLADLMDGLDLTFENYDQINSLMNSILNLLDDLPQTYAGNMTQEQIDALILAQTAINDAQTALAAAQASGNTEDIEAAENALALAESDLYDLVSFLNQDERPEGFHFYHKDGFYVDGDTAYFCRKDKAREIFKAYNGKKRLSSSEVTLTSSLPLPPSPEKPPTTFSGGTAYAKINTASTSLYGETITANCSNCGGSIKLTIIIYDVNNVEYKNGENWLPLPEESLDICIGTEFQVRANLKPTNLIHKPAIMGEFKWSGFFTGEGTMQTIKPTIDENNDYIDTLNISICSGSKLTKKFHLKHTLFAENSGQAFGFDSNQVKYYKNTYEPDGSKYAGIPWKSVELNGSSPDALDVSIISSVAETTNFGLPTPPKFTINPAQITGTTATLGLQSVNGTNKDIAELTATFQSDASCVSGALNVIALQKKTKSVTVIIVHKLETTGGVTQVIAPDLGPLGTTAPNAATIKAELDDIYRYALVDWNVIVDTIQVDWDDDNDTFIDTEHVDGVDFNTEENLIIDRCKARFTQAVIDNRDAILFLVGPTQLTNSSGGTTTSYGRFPFDYSYAQPTKRYGFLYPVNATIPQMFYKTMGHELGHGVFRLRHPFGDVDNGEIGDPIDAPNYPKPKNPEGGSPDNTNPDHYTDPDNLMDYFFIGKKLRKYQWDYIHQD